MTGSLDLYYGLAEASHRVVQLFGEQVLRSNRSERMAVALESIKLGDLA